MFGQCRKVVQSRWHELFMRRRLACHDSRDRLLRVPAQQIDLPLLLSDQLFYATGFSIKITGDGLLSVEVRYEKIEVLDRIIRDAAKAACPRHAGDASRPKFLG